MVERLTYEALIEFIKQMSDIELVKANAEIKEELADRFVRNFWNN